MPAFDLRHVRVAKYNNNAGAVTYGARQSAGDAMTASLELTFAEGSLYAEGRMAEYVREATGGTISIGTKYIPAEAQKLMYGSQPKTRTIGTKTVESLVESADDAASYVGVSFYAPDRIDGVTKYTCVFIPKALFGPPGMSYQTKNNTITFQTPTTTGQFMADDSSGKVIREVAIVDDMETAIAWCDAVFGAAAEEESGT